MALRSSFQNVCFPKTFPPLLFKKTNKKKSKKKEEKKALLSFSVGVS